LPHAAIHNTALAAAWLLTLAIGIAMPSILTVISLIRKVGFRSDRAVSGPI